MQLDEGLRQFGFDSFRPGQQEAIETLLDTGRLLLVAPTGGGKSLVYQLPGSLLPGTTIVVSPLIALMHDQIAALDDHGIAATYLASTLEPDELRTRMRAIQNGEYKLVYVAPERLGRGGFRNIVAGIDCPLIAIDEAHCISEWGHDFRPDYMQIGDLLRAVPQARVLACTATATPVVRDEILARLGLPAETPQFVRGFARPELHLRAAEVMDAKDRRTRTDAMLLEALGDPANPRGAAIVYGPTRKSTEKESTRLRKLGWQSDFYHAGVDGEERRRISEGFARGTIDVVVATNAFGMGIDRADVRAVIHLAPPSSIEAYYQEVGRAGRDGDPAYGLLLASTQDLPLRRRLINRDGLDPEIVEHKWGLFLELMRWVEGGSCRHDAILRYFGAEEAADAHGCGRCDVCLSFDDVEQDHAAIELIVRKALSGIARVHHRFGLALAAKLLRGVDDERLEWSGLKEVSTFGVLSEHKEEWLVRLLRRCVTAGWVDFTGGERPLVRLTESGREVMTGRRPARLLLPSETVAASKTSRKKSAADDDLDEGQRAIFELLRAHRMEIAQSEEVPAYVVASDRTLRDLARMRPTNRTALMQAHGIGPSKAEKYGETWLSVIRQAEA
ncbi:MAG: RecQ family ATP-dependent DNA helicase [Planctomycetota bacterium]